MFRAQQIFTQFFSLIRVAPLPQGELPEAHYCSWAQAMVWSQHLWQHQPIQDIRLKPDALEIVQGSRVEPLQNTHSLVSFDSETQTAAFSAHNLLQPGSFNLCHSDITKPTLAVLPLLSALQGPCEHHNHGKVLKWHFLHTWQVLYRTHNSLKLLSKSDRPTSSQHWDKLRQHTEAHRQQVGL